MTNIIKSYKNFQSAVMFKLKIICCMFSNSVKLLCIKTFLIDTLLNEEEVVWWFKYL